jgi:hypothetical protein
LRVTLPFKPEARHEIVITAGGEPTVMTVDGSPLHFQRLIEDFVIATLDGRPPLITMSESRGNAATLAALYASARTGRPALV